MDAPFTLRGYPQAKFRVFEAYGWPFFDFLTQIFFLWRRGSENACKPVFWKFERQKMLEK